MVKMDPINLHILQLLQGNARMTVAQIASTVGRSESVVRERLSALEVGGVLKGYEARMDWGQVGLPTTVIVSARCDPARVGELAQRLRQVPNVTRAWMMTGSRPILIMLRVRDTAHLEQVMREGLSELGLSGVEVQLGLETLVDHRPPSLPGPDSLQPAP